jgi:putative ATP-binding cassette transporter
MKLWEFLRKEADFSGTRLIFFAAVSGLSNALILVIINTAAERVSDRQQNTQFLFLFAVAITIYILAQKYVLKVSTIEIEKMIDKLRVRLADKIRKADLQPLEGLGRSEIYASVNKETLTISQSAAPLVIAGQAAIMVCCTVLYIYFLSKPAFVLALIIIGLGVSIHFKKLRHVLLDMHQSTAKENNFFDLLTHLLEGFKEVKLNSARSADLFRNLQEVAASVAELKTKTSMHFANHYLFSQISFYLLIAAMVFILPRLSETYWEEVTEITAAILFIVGPLTGVVSAIPVLSGANVAIENVERLEATLERLRRDENDEEVRVLPEFDGIRLDRVLFQYADQRGRPLFTVGPVDLSIKRGEVVFVVGGNGSGKSTFLKLLTALYYPLLGIIHIDGTDVETLGYGNYRNLFSAIFSDYHLFDRLYGLGDVPESTVEELLKLMRLESKTRYKEGRFENQDLSTGQKKRLALIVSLLENKPIYVFDEWAADQDPEFRQFFYETLLADLKKQGKTVIAATHDDRYFHLADRVYRMQDGQIYPFTAK